MMKAKDWLAEAFKRSSDPANLKLAALDLPEFERLWRGIMPKTKRLLS